MVMLRRSLIVNRHNSDHLCTYKQSTAYTAGTEGRWEALGAIWELVGAIDFPHANSRRKFQYLLKLFKYRTLHKNPYPSRVISRDRDRQLWIDGQLIIFYQFSWRGTFSIPISIFVFFLSWWHIIVAIKNTFDSKLQI